MGEQGRKAFRIKKKNLLTSFDLLVFFRANQFDRMSTVYLFIYLPNIYTG